jgi:DNA-binding transcriptional regulator GbsR (MarR family)
MPLPATSERFILHWGEMGTRWGVNRTVAQIHALLFLSPKPMHAEEIAAALSVARSNVSTSIRELQSWGLVRVVHVLGDRRDHFETSTDIWEMFRTIFEERKRREIDPTLAFLREASEAPAKTQEEKYARERITDMRTFFEDVESIYHDLQQSPRAVKAVQLRGKLRRWLSSITASKA